MKPDRLSRLPDELIHRILSSTHAKLAVQTSILSKRWKLIWTTLPFLNFYDESANDIKLINNFLSHRNAQSVIFKLSCSLGYDAPPGLLHELLDYAISHGVEDLNFDIDELDMDDPEYDVTLSTLASASLKKLELKFVHDRLSSSHCWILPALTTLKFKGACTLSTRTFPGTYLTCLCSLRTLLLEYYDLPNPISLPLLTTLCLKGCRLPSDVCDFPALSTLTLDHVVFPQRMTQFFPALVKLQNLTVFFRGYIEANRYINCPQLVNLKIVSLSDSITSHSAQFIVLAPKLRNFTSVGLFPITFGVSQLKNMNVKLRGPIPNATSEQLKRFYGQVNLFLRGLGSARILTLDLETIEALSAVSNYFTPCNSPFYNLKYVIVPERFEGSIIPPRLRWYLLGGSAKGTIVTTLPQDELVPQELPVCLTSQKVLTEKPL